MQCEWSKVNFCTTSQCCAVSQWRTAATATLLSDRNKHSPCFVPDHICSESTAGKVPCILSHLGRPWPARVWLGVPRTRLGFHQCNWEQKSGVNISICKVISCDKNASFQQKYTHVSSHQCFFLSPQSTPPGQHAPSVRMKVCSYDPFTSLL